jgi:EmrB/QacA subfamily drug resistance transporter
LPSQRTDRFLSGEAIASLKCSLQNESFAPSKRAPPCGSRNLFQSSQSHHLAALHYLHLKRSPAIRLKPSSNTPSSTHGKWVLAATILASSMAFIDGTVVNVALPALQSALQASATQLQWVVESYALLLASLLLCGGSLGDLYGRRRFFLLGVVLFTLASLGCSLAPTIGVLIFARALQGIGAALLIPGSLAIVSASFPESERGRAIGTWSGFTAITTAIGPVLGGWLVQHVSWRSVFLINIPLAIAVLGIAHSHIAESRDDRQTPGLDWPGALLVTFGLGAVTFALIEAPTGGRSVLITGIAGILLLAAFILVELRSAHPMMSLQLFRSLDFAGTNLLTLMLYGALGGLLYFLPLDLIQVQHYSATAAGASLLPFVVLIFLISRWSGGLIATYGARLPLTVGPLIACAGFLLMLRVGLPAPYWTRVFPAVITLGLGLAITVAPLTTAVMQSLPAIESGIASGVNNAVSRIASLLAVAVFGLVLTAAFNHSLNKTLPTLTLTSTDRQTLPTERTKLAGATTPNPQLRQALDVAFVNGFHDVVWISAALAFLSALAAQMVSSKTTPSRPT